MFGRAPWLPLFVTFAVYPCLAWLVLRFSAARFRTWLFAVVNVGGAYVMCFSGLVDGNFNHPALAARIIAVFFCFYLFLVVIHYWILWRAERGTEGWRIAALWFPIAMLILFKYIPLVDRSFASILHKIVVVHVAVLFLGLSYLTFRQCHLVQEVRNGLVAMPTLGEYLSFAFFVPTLSVGPINPYSRYIESYRKPSADFGLRKRALLRILVGLTKYLFLSSLLNQYTYSGLLLDGHPHRRIDLVVALFAYTLYLYCNFSGFCDMVVGVSGLLGIDVIENFDVPFASRNLQEFWTKWHISLSTWLRDMMFTPMVKLLVRRFGQKSANHAIAFSVCVVFLVIGVWHGVGINFALFGLFHGVGLAGVHYYTVFLKKKLGKQRFAEYRASRWIYAVGAATTFVYFSASLFLFANSWENMQHIFKMMAS